MKSNAIVYHSQDQSWVQGMTSEQARADTVISVVISVKRTHITQQILKHVANLVWQNLLCADVGEEARGGGYPYSRWHAHSCAIWRVAPTSRGKQCYFVDIKMSEVSVVVADCMPPLEDALPIPTNTPKLIEGNLESVLGTMIVQGADLWKPATLGYDSQPKEKILPVGFSGRAQQR